jgi:hypothetical protein
VKTIIISSLLIVFGCAAHPADETISIERKAYAPSDIVLINVGEAGRCETSFMLRNINAGNPKAIGMNLLYTERKKLDCDTMLMNAMATSNAIIIKGWSGTSYIEPWKDFADAAFSVGITGLVKDTSNCLDFHLRLFEENGKRSLSFPMLLALQFDKERTLMALTEVSMQDYPTVLKFKMNDFKVVPRSEVLSADKSMFTDKLVILGYLGPLNEDRHKIHDSTGIAIEEYSTVITANIVLDVLNTYVGKEMKDDTTHFETK